MTTAGFWGRVGRTLTVTPAIAVGLATILLAVSLALAIFNEGLNRTKSAREAQVQTEILAASVAAPLAFNDDAAAQEYVNALRANPAIEAVGAYNAQGRLSAGFHRTGAPEPPARNTLAPPSFQNDLLIVTAGVFQGTTRLGSVYLRVRTEDPLRRLSRYVGIGVIVVMASLLVAVLGSSHARLREAHDALQAEIGEREKAQEALRQAQKMEAMGQLTGGVAHDFNNLLMVASSGLDLLDRTNDPERRERLKQAIRQAIDRGAGLTQQLLAFARRAPVHAEVVDIPASLQGMRTLLERSLRENVEVKLKLAADVWPVEVDPSQFEVAILNVAINARDAMPQGGAITVSAENVRAADESSDDVVVISVSDTGEGVAPELIQRLFEPFFTTKEVGQGTGLGLSQVYGFARSSGGDVSFESKVGEGSTVRLRLPRSLKKAPINHAPVAAEAAQADRRRRILLVEDDDTVARLVEEMLSELGYETLRTADAAAALDTLEKESGVEVVFSDMVMPGKMDGLQLAEEIARRRPHLPIILTTGYSAAAASATSKGFRLLIKPYRIEALANELKAATER